MESKSPHTYKFAYKWLSWGLAAAFGIYWLFTFGLVLFSSKFSGAVPDATFVYRSFARQNWRMFAITKVYNRQMLFITRETANPLKADTTDLVQYMLAEKRGYAPFNNKQDAYDRILYIVMNGVETRVHYHEKKMKDTIPGKPDMFYQQQAIQFVQSDTAHRQEINNIVGFARYVMQQKGVTTDGKEYKFIIKHKYIPPAKPVLPAEPGGDEQILFTSDYKPL